MYMYVCMCTHFLYAGPHERDQTAYHSAIVDSHYSTPMRGWRGRRGEGREGRGGRRRGEEGHGARKEKVALVRKSLEQHYPGL